MVKASIARSTFLLRERFAPPGFPGGAFFWSYSFLRRGSPRDLIEASPSLMGGLVKRHLVRGLSTDGRSMRSRKGSPGAEILLQRPWSLEWLRRCATPHAR